MRGALGGVCVAAALSLAATDVLACGGCFHPPSADSVVTGHRMAFAVAGDRTVLWDQIKYTGEPSDFAWVLPIEPGAYVETASDAFFETLDAFSVATVTAPNVLCASANSGNSGCGFSSSADDSKASPTAAGYDGPSVNVIHEGTVGPYDTVTLSASNGGSLRVWLGDHGYSIPPDIDPVIDSYVAEGSDFIALRLSPGQGVNSMQPVRVVTPGGPAMLPLRMVAAGTGQFVDIVLFVLGEGRYQLDDFHETFVDPAKITFDVQANQSNYLAVREDALGMYGGYSFLTAFATPSPFELGAQTNGQFGFQPYSFAETYFQQAAQDDGRSLTESCSNVDAALARSGVVGSDIPPASLTCSGYSDLSAALEGMNPRLVWLTRLELDLPREALGADCKVSLSKTQANVSGKFVATRVVNRSASCPEPVFTSSIIPPAGTSAAAFFWGMAAFVGLFGLRRSRTVRR
ncbi:MAG TPA: DUF2330 domain-containing protein [Polyangiaceae bacterium]|nr:DUF2330 domain-containing protein [Polyangiaceae bacterium]